MNRYRKIDPRFWKDEKIIQFSPEEKLTALYLFTGQSNRIGIFSFSPGEAAEDLGTLPQTFAERFQNVCRTLNIGWDETFRVLFIPTWWKYNQPENVNNVIGNLKDLDDVPKSHLVDLFAENLEHLPENLRETFTRTLAKRYPQRYPQRSPTQEQEQEQEYKKGAEAPATLRSLSGGSENKNGSDSPSDVYEQEFETEIKPAYPKRDGDYRWQQAVKSYRAARKSGEPKEVILAGIQRYKRWCEAKGLIGTDKVKQAASFLGKEKCWGEPWDIPAGRAAQVNGGFVG